MLSYTGARPKTKSILHKNVNAFDNILPDTTVPTVPTVNPIPIQFSSTPRTSSTRTNRTINNLPVDRPTRSNKNYVPLKRIPNPENLFSKRNLHSRTEKSIGSKIKSFFTPSPKTPIAEVNISPIDKPICNRFSFPKDDENIISDPVLIPSTVLSSANQLEAENKCIINNLVATPDTVIDITDENLIQIADGILNPPQFVENNNIFIQNNSEISVDNHRSSAEDTDSFFAILNRLGDFLRNPPIQTNPPIVSCPSAENSSTLEAINNPVDFTPYYQLDIINELDPLNNATGGPVESVDLIEFPLIKSNSHGQVGDKLQNTINSQQIRLHCQGRAEEITPELQNVNSDDKIINVNHKEGAGDDRYSHNSRSDQKRYQESIRSSDPLSLSIPSIPNPSPINIADERVIFVPDDSERVDSPFICICDKCSKRADSNNQIHQCDRGIFETDENILEGARKKRFCLDSENTRHSLATQTTQTSDNYPELPSLLIDPYLSYKIQFNNHLDRYQRIFNPSTTAEREIPAPFSINNSASGVHSAADERLDSAQGIFDSRGAQQKLGDEIGIPSNLPRRNQERRGFINHSAEGDERTLKRRSDKSESIDRGIFKSEKGKRPTESKPINISKQEEYCRGEYPGHRKTSHQKMSDNIYRNPLRPNVYCQEAGEFSDGDRNERRNENRNYGAFDEKWRKGKFTHSRRSSDTPSSDSDADSFYVKYQPSGKPTNGHTAKRYHNSSPIRCPSPKKENGGKEFRTFSDTHKGRGAITMLNQIQNYTGSPAVHFDRWIKLFDNVVAMSNWNNSDIVSMLSTKMSGDAYDFLQNIMESDTIEYSKIKALFQENFHGDEDADFYQEKFDEMQRKPKENILNYAFRLKTIYQRAYPSNKLETQEEKSSQLQFLRQKFLQGLESELQHIIRYN